jgi:hypothetical protein
VGDEQNICSILPAHSCLPVSPSAGAKRRSVRRVGKQLETCSTSPACSPVSNMAPLWASVVRDSVRIPPPSLKIPTAEDYSNLYKRCMASNFHSHVTFSYATDTQKVDIFFFPPHPPPLLLIYLTDTGVTNFVAMILLLPSLPVEECPLCPHALAYSSLSL